MTINKELTYHLYIRVYLPWNVNRINRGRFRVRKHNEFSENQINQRINLK